MSSNYPKLATRNGDRVIARRILDIHSDNALYTRVTVAPESGVGAPITEIKSKNDPTWKICDDLESVNRFRKLKPKTEHAKERQTILKAIAEIDKLRENLVKGLENV